MSVDTLELAKLDVLGRLEAIEKRLKEQDPDLPIHMSTIHKTLLTHEELVHVVLTDANIHTYMAAMQKYKNIQLVAEAQKSRSRKKQDADDF